MQEAAEKLGVTRQSLHGWLAGRVRPSIEARQAVREIYGIPVKKWLLPAELGD